MAGLYDPSSANLEQIPLVKGAGVIDRSFLTTYEYVVGNLIVQKLYVETPIDNSYKLTFDEEFNGTAVDPSVWSVPNGVQDLTYTTYNAEFRSENLQVANGLLDLSVTKELTPGGRDYGTAGMTTTNFLQTYGNCVYSKDPAVSAVNPQPGYGGPGANF